MCLYSREGANPRYRPNKKNGGNTPIPKYDILKRTTFKCGYCLECRRERGNSWRIRLQEELKEHERSMFVTLTFSNESIQELIGACGDVDEANLIAKKAIRRFLERKRKEDGKSVKHWFIVEIGGNSTERIHIHGIIFGEHWSQERLQKLWKYGRSDVGYECSNRTITYITKYLTKVDEVHKDFIASVMTSPALGLSYVRKHRHTHRFRFEKTVTEYRGEDGKAYAIPKYYREKLWTEEEREELRVYAEAERGKGRRVGKTEYKVETYEEFMVFEAAMDEYRGEMERLGFPTPWKTKRRRYKCINGSYRVYTITSSSDFSFPL